MTLRTRMAFMVILLLLGCVFAAPFYQTAVSTVDTSNSSADSHADTSFGVSATASLSSDESSLPTLQIRRTLTKNEMLEQKQNQQAQGNTPPQSILKRPRNHNFENQGGGYPTTKRVFNQPIPALTLPTPTGIPSVRERAINNRFASSATKPAPASDAKKHIHHASQRSLTGLDDGEQTRPRLRPVSLIGTNIGTSFASESSTTTEIRWDQQAPSGLLKDTYAEQTRLRPAGQSHVSTERSFTNSASQRPDLAPVRFSNSKPTQSGFVVTNTKKRWHRISRFDTLNELSQKYYGSADYALFIFEANRQKLVNPAILPIGLELIIPPQPDRTKAEPNSLPTSPHEYPPTPLTPIDVQHGWKRAQEEDYLTSL